MRVPCFRRANKGGRVAASLFGIGVAVSLLVMAGCSKNEPAAPATLVAAGDGPAAGKVLFSANCKRCHTVNGEGGRRGPELTHIGAETGKNQEWFVKFLKDPTAQNPRSRMPSFSHLSQKELDNLGAYLTSLK